MKIPEANSAKGEPGANGGLSVALIGAGTARKMPARLNDDLLLGGRVSRGRLVARWHHRSQSLGQSNAPPGIRTLASLAFRERSDRQGVRPGLLCLLAALTFLSKPAYATELYRIDQSDAHIEFTARHFGVLSSHATFRFFNGTLSIDPDHAEHTAIAILINAASVEVNWPGGETMLRSADYFDAGHYPLIRFTSTQITAEPGTRYLISGLLEIRGVTKPVQLEAEFAGRQTSGPAGTSLSLFQAKGQISRSDFGMTSGTAFISDRIDLQITARILVPLSAGSG